VAPDGTFLARVQITEPKTRVHVEAEDVTGRQKTVDKILHPAPRAPSLQTSGDELWKE
jgi:phosphomannomutase